MMDVTTKPGRVRESGQTLVIVALALIALLGFLALAIDVGVLYAWRRNMQNAADAGALAGARIICTGGSEEDATDAAEEYALTQNRAEDAEVVIDAGRVAVTTTVDVNLFFARALGVDQSGVTAHAVALCGPGEGSCAMWPIAFAVEAWELLPTLDCGDDPDALGETFVIIDSNKICDECDTEACYNCVDDPDEDDKFGGNRAWLDFPVPDKDIYEKTCGGGTNCLIYWMQNPYPIVIEPIVCIEALDGTKTDALAEASNWVGSIVAIPLFDQIVPKSSACPLGDDIEGIGNNVNRYQIVDYACIKVVGYHSQYPIYETNEEGEDEFLENVKAIEVRQTCSECYQDCGSTAGGSFTPGGLTAVSLIE